MMNFKKLAVQTMAGLGLLAASNMASAVAIDLVASTSGGNTILEVNATGVAGATISSYYFDIGWDAGSFVSVDFGSPMTALGNLAASCGFFCNSTTEIFGSTSDTDVRVTETNLFAAAQTDDIITLATLTFTGASVFTYLGGSFAGPGFTPLPIATQPGLTVAVVPAPATALLLGLGLVGLAWRGRRRSV